MTDELGARAPKYQRIADALRRKSRPVSTSQVTGFHQRQHCSTTSVTIRHPQPADVAPGDRAPKGRGPD